MFIKSLLGIKETVKCYSDNIIPDAMGKQIF